MRRVFLIQTWTALQFGTMVCFHASSTDAAVPPSQPSSSSYLKRSTNSAGNLPHFVAGLNSLRRGDREHAKQQLDKAIENMNGVFGLGHSAKQARSYTGEEAKKFFLGESHERSFACLLRGLLYLDDNELDNARACFKSASFHDIDIKAKPPVSDMFLAEYLDYKLLAAQAGSHSVLPTDFKETFRNFPAIDLGENCHIVVEVGSAPVKRAFGQHKHILAYDIKYPWFQGLEVTVNAKTVAVCPPEDFLYHATSRGSRDMDKILALKSQMKTVSGTTGDAALLSAAAIAASDSDALGVALIVGGVGLVLKGISAIGNPAVDTRYWTNQPRFLWYSAAAAHVGTNSLKLSFKDKFGDPVHQIKTNFVIQPTSEKRHHFLFLSAVGNEY